jgi:hypothetical protein
VGKATSRVVLVNCRRNLWSARLIVVSQVCVTQWMNLLLLTDSECTVRLRMGAWVDALVGKAMILRVPVARVLID